MGVQSNLVETVQEIYFDLVDLEKNLYTKGIKLDGFEEFENLFDFVNEQISKLNYLEDHMKTLFNIEEK